MILNGWSVVDLFVVSVRIGLAVVVLFALCTDLFARRGLLSALEPDESGEPSEAGERGERNRALSMLAGASLLTLSVLAWPMFYAVLQSYVPHWSGVMCIYGVTRVGEASQGISRFLPTLVAGVEWTKPLAVFLSGAWGTLYWVDRQRAYSHHRRTAALLLGMFALTSLADAGMEGVYLCIPKREATLEAGCCVGALSEVGRAGRFLPSTAALALGDRGLGIVTLAISGTLLIGLAYAVTFASDRALTGLLPWLMLLAAATVPTGLLCLRQILAPRFLNLPYHYCAYDLWSRAPESLVGVALGGLGAFSVGWAGVAALAERSRRGRSTRGLEMTRQLLFVGLTGYVAGGVLLGVEWWLTP